MEIPAGVDSGLLDRLYFSVHFDTTVAMTGALNNLSLQRQVIYY